MRLCARLATPLLLVALPACGEQPEQSPQPKGPARAPIFLNINPSWSPDGTELVFESRRDSGVALYIIGANGRDERLLLRNGSENTHPDWSPDGARIVFDSNRGGKFNIFTMLPDGTGERQLTTSDSDSPEVFGRHPAWSPDSRRIAFDSERDGNGEIYVMNADGTGLQRVTNSRGNESHPAWMPDGRVVFVAAGEDTASRSLLAVAPDGSQRQVLARLPAGSGGPEISRDGLSVVFFRQEGERARLFKLTLADSEPVAITPSSKVAYETEWSPDGRVLALYLGDPGDFELYLINADGSALRRLAGR